MATVKKSTVVHKDAPPAKAVAKTAAVKTVVKQVEKAAAKTEALAKAAVLTAAKVVAAPAAPKKPSAVKTVKHAPEPTKPTTAKDAKPQLKVVLPTPRKSTGKPSVPKAPADSRAKMNQQLQKLENKTVPAPARAPAVLHSNLGSRRVVEDNVTIGAAVQVAKPQLASGMAALAAQETRDPTTPVATTPVSAPAASAPEERSTPQATTVTAARTPVLPHGIAALASGEPSGPTAFNHGTVQPAALPRLATGPAPAGSPFITRTPAAPTEQLSNPGLLERRFEVYNDGLGSYRWRLVHASTGNVLALCKNGWGTPTAACEAAEAEAKLYKPGTSTVIRLNYTPR